MTKIKKPDSKGNIWIKCKKPNTMQAHEKE